MSITLSSTRQIVKGVSLPEKNPLLKRIEILMAGAPIGNTNASKNHVKQTDTSEFKKWFGKSAVKDESGKPLRVYHGTTSDFEKFEVQKEGVLKGTGTSGGLIWFTNNAVLAGQYAENSGAETLEEARNGANLIPAYIKIERPLRVTGTGSRKEISNPKYDGLIIIGNNGVVCYAVKNPLQIKSAIGNSGKFDQKDPRITARLSKRIESLFVKAAQPKTDSAATKARLAARAIYEQAALSAAALKAKHHKEMVAAILLLLLIAGEEAYAKVYAELGVEELKSADATQLKEQAETFAAIRQPKLKNYSAKLAEDLSKALLEAQNEDSSPAEILRQLRHIARNTSQIMAETEAQCTYGAVQIDRLKRQGYTKKIWVTEDDDKVRHSHEECEEQGAIDIDKPFVNGLFYPGQSDAPISEIIGCRCELRGANRK